MTSETVKTFDDALIETALRNMFEKGWFDICTMREIVKVTGVIPRQDIMDRLALIHCVNFGKMPRQMLEALPGMISEALNGYRIDFDAIVRPPQLPRETIVTPAEAQRKHPLLRLLGRG